MNNSMQKICNYCCLVINPEDVRTITNDLPKDISLPKNHGSGMSYHKWCFEQDVMYAIKQDIKAA